MIGKVHQHDIERHIQSIKEIAPTAKAKSHYLRLGFIAWLNLFSVYTKMTKLYVIVVL